MDMNQARLEDHCENKFFIPELDGNLLMNRKQGFRAYAMDYQEEDGSTQNLMLLATVFPKKSNYIYCLLKK